MIGDFRAGINSPADCKELTETFLSASRTHQIVIEVKKCEQTVLLQYLLNCSVREPFHITLNLFTKLPPRGHNYDKASLLTAEKVHPVLPAQNGYVIDYYRHNGYVYTK